MKERLNARIITTGLALTVAGLALSGCSETSDTTFVVGVDCPSDTDVVIGDIRSNPGSNQFPGSATVEVGCAQEGSNPSVAPRSVEVLEGRNVVEVNDPSNDGLTKVEFQVDYDSSGLDSVESYTQDPYISVRDQSQERPSQPSVEIIIEDIDTLERVEIVS